MTHENSPLISRRSLLFAGLGLGLGLAGCATTGSGQPPTSTRDEGRASLKVASLKGPTSMGIASLMDKAQKGMLRNDLEFTVAGSPDEVIPAIAQGGFDIALVPANAAAVLYAKTNASVSVININTLGVLSVVTADDSVNDLTDLAGRTVYLAGKGASPEFAMNYLLGKAGVANDVTLEFLSEATEVVATLAADSTGSAVAVLPQPFVTVALSKFPSLRAAVDLSEAWDKLSDDGSQLVQGVTIVRNEVLSAHPSAVREFMDEQALSVEAANAHPRDVAPLVVSAGILDSEDIAAAAIPACHLVCVEGREMKDALSGYLQTLLDANAASVGGSLPGDDFYHQG